MRSTDWASMLHEDHEGYDEAVNHFQPETSNPHSGSPDKSSEEISESIRRSLESRLDERTIEFEDRELSERHLYLAAAEISRQLEHEFDEGEGYLMAEIGSEGVKPIAMGDKEEFFIDEAYDPRIIAEEVSPLGIMDRTGYSKEIGFSVIDYNLSELSAQGIELWPQWPFSKEDMEDNNYRIVVAPGLGEQYQGMASNLPD